MSVIAIRADGLSKQYRIGGKQEGYRTLRDTLADAFVSPLRRARRLLSGQAYGAAGLNRTIWALKDVSFEIKRGEVVGIIGRNGAGKTTLLKILSRITEPTAGQAEINGRVGSLLEVGTGFHPELTGRENVYLNGAILGMRKAEIERKFDEIVDFAEIEKFIDTPVKHYSSGMYVRLAFSVAAHLEPQILMVDEVLAVGDAAFQRKCLGKMDEVATAGRTVLFVSHNMAAVQKLCPLSLLLDNGKIISYGETQLVLEEYFSSAVGKGFENDSLESLPRLTGLGEDIRFTQCSILNSQGKTRNHILFGEPFSICLEAIARKELRDLSIVIGIDSFMENRITSVASEDSDIFFSASPNQPLRVRAHFITLALKPGIYLITIGIRLGVRGLDHLPYVAKLEVAEIHQKDSKQYSVSLGPIHTVADWDNFT